MACQLRDVEVPAVDLRIAAVGARDGLLADQRGGSHLTTRHTVDGVVDEDHRDVLATVESVERLSTTDTSHIAVALVGEHQAVGPYALDSRSHSGSASVGCLRPVDVEVAVCEHGATYRAYTDGLVLHAHLLDDLGHELMDYTVRTSRTVVHRDVVHQFWFLIYQILWCNNVVCHLILLFKGKPVDSRLSI